MKNMNDIFKSMRESINPDDNVKEKLYRKIERGEIPMNKPAPKILKWLPLMTAACMLIVATAVFLPMFGALREQLPPEGGNIDYLNEPNFTGAVVSVYENGGILIKTEAGNPYPDSTLITSSVIAGDEFFVGDIVTVYYDGMLMESYPVQIRTPHAIELISRDRRHGDYYADEWVFDAYETHYLNTPDWAETFVWTNGQVSAVYGNDEQFLFSTNGIIGGIFVADLTGDGKIDFIYLYFDGSYEYIMLYDYVNDTSYSIMNIKDTYRLSLDNGKIMVNETTVLSFMGGRLVTAVTEEEVPPPNSEPVISEPMYFVERNENAASEEFYPEIFLYPEGFFTFNVNLWEGLSKVHGTYERVENAYVFTVTYRDFAGFTGDDVEEFKMHLMLGADALVYEGAQIGMTEDGAVFYMSEMPSVSYLHKFIMALPSGDSDSVAVVHDTRVMERYEAAKLAELTVDIVNLLDGNVMYMSSSWLDPWADLYGGRKLESINQIDIIYMYKGDGGAVFQVIAHCEFDIDDGRNEVGIEYTIVDIGGGGATGNLEWQVLDIYFVK